MKLPAITPRNEGEPVADLTVHRVVHRAMCLDVRELADLTAFFAGGDGSLTAQEQRLIGVSDYLTRVFDVISCHHETEDELVWPILAVVAEGDAGLSVLAGHTAEHQQLGRMLAGANGLTEALAAAPGDRGLLGRLSVELQRMYRLLEHHVVAEERQVFPLITAYVRADDYTWVLQQSRARLRPALLAFAVPWVIHHAVPDEVPGMLAEASRGMRVLLRIFQDRFAAQRRLVFG